MPRKSAGILIYRFHDKILEVFLVHPGGPFWAKKDEGAWTIPKGEFEDEDPLEAAKRELMEETGLSVSGEFLELSPVKLKSGKIIYAFAIEADADPSSIKSNSFEIEWPPRSGELKEFPEVDKASWFTLDEARIKISGGQIGLLEELEKTLKASDAL